MPNGEGSRAAAGVIMPEENNITISKGSILIYRVFDIGGEVSLAEVEKCLAGDSRRVRFCLATDVRKAIIIREAPLMIDLGEKPLRIGDAHFRAEVSAKIWNYGVMSVTVRLPIPENISWGGLVDIAAQIENSREIDAVATDYKNSLRERILPAIENPTDWGTFEDYITWFIEKIEGVNDPAQLLLKADIPGLILAENREPLSENSRKFIVENALQYGKNDLAVIDWNSALIVSPDGQRDVADVIEFCLTHLLEMRYYDELLEQKLLILYDSIEKTRGAIIKNPYARLAEDASREYIEFSEFLGRVENSLKTVGDSYLATVFRTANREFRFGDWRQSIARKMESLAQISELLQGEINARRSHLLEAIIILLIAIEIVPVFWDAFMK